MKKFAIFILLIFMVGCGSNGGDNDTVNILNIRDIQSDPFAFTGELTINGIVTDFYESDTTIFRLKDTVEMMVCLQLDCDTFRLPVRYIGGGELPQVADEINITGRWSNIDEVVIFDATNIEVKRNIMPVIERGTR